MAENGAAAIPPAAAPPPPRPDPPLSLPPSYPASKSSRFHRQTAAARHGGAGGSHGSVEGRGTPPGEVPWGAPPRPLPLHCPWAAHPHPSGGAHWRLLLKRRPRGFSCRGWPFVGVEAGRPASPFTCGERGTGAPGEGAKGCSAPSPTSSPPRVSGGREGRRRRLPPPPGAQQTRGAAVATTPPRTSPGRVVRRATRGTREGETLLKHLVAPKSPVIYYAQPVTCLICEIAG